MQETVLQMDHEGILGPRIEDAAPSTIFDKILAKEIPSAAVYEDDFVYAFKVCTVTLLIILRYIHIPDCFYCNCKYGGVHYFLIILLLMTASPTWVF